MARKKSRQPRPSATTAIKTPPASRSGENGASVNGNGVHTVSSQAIQEAATGLLPVSREAIVASNGSAITVDAPSASAKPQAAAATPDSDLARFAKKFTNIFGSLQLAVILLTIFAGVVLLGTLMEHYYSTSISQGLVYRAWWFNCLLLMLAVTIFCAAAKKMKFNTEPLHLAPITATTFFGKVRGYWDQTWASISHFWPWKRHQFGFIVTHIGLITMLTGGLMNSWFGVDCMMNLIDTNDPIVRQAVADRNGNVPQSANDALYPDLADIRVMEQADMKGVKPKTYAQDFWGGPFPWNNRPTKEPPKTDMLLSVMNFLHNPLGNSWSMNLDKDARLEVVDYLPLARPIPFAKADDGPPAMQLQFRSDKFAQPVDKWVSLNPTDLQFNLVGLGPASIEGMGLCKASLVQEFLNPPSPADLGKKGVLAVHVGGKTQRVSVSDHWKAKLPLGTSGWSVEINKFVDDADDAKQIDQQFGPWVGAFGPALGMTIWDPKGNTTELMVLAWQPNKIWNLEKASWVEPGQKGVPPMFYHGADVERAQAKQMKTTGLLQLVAASDGQLYYRSYTRDKDGKNFVVEKAGAVDVENQREYPIWQKMGWRFRVLEYLPHAQRTDDYAPVNIAPGKETEMEKEMYKTVIFCRLTVGKDKQEFWLRKGSGQKVQVGERKFVVRYDYKVRNLAFTLKLERAETTRDPGTGSPATYSSFVQVFDPKHKVNGERFLITMNEPLEYGGYTFYQSSLQFTDEYDATGKPVNISGFTVGHDPGISLKYAGSIMLALGIAIMFYMKAYFFKPRRRPAGGTAPT